MRSLEQVNIRTNVRTYVRTYVRTHIHTYGTDPISPPQLCCARHVVHSPGLRIPAPTRSLKSSKVGADITLAGRPFQRRTVDGKKDPLYALIEQDNGRIR